jgi:hypothetical protein
MTLVKAKLVKLGDGDSPAVLETIPVQFNPSTLKLTLGNRVEGGQNPGRPQQQFGGAQSTSLAFELVFDTADEGTADAPRSVREKTAKIEQFVLPDSPAGERQSSPRVRFEWGSLRLVGLIDSLSIDFDLFASTGEPLRAKMAITIREQKPEYQLMQKGSGSEKGGNAPPAGKGGGDAAPGNAAGGANDARAGSLGVALGGESAADFALRMGLNPGAWRGVAAGLEGTLSLTAGAEIDFDASVSLSARVGVAVGFEADVGVSLEASLGLEASASISAGASFSASAQAAAGFALSAAGGVQAAVETVAIAKATAAASASVQAFGATAASVSAALPTGGGSSARSGVAAAVQGGASAGAAAGGGAVAASSATGGGAGGAGSSRAANLTTAAGGSAGARAATTLAASSPSPATTASVVPNAYAPPRADPRATSYGFGVPLRPRTGAAAQASAGVVALRPYTRAREVPVTRDPTAPAWEQLPAASAPLKPRYTPVTPPKTSAPAVKTRGCCGCGGGKGGGR